MMRRTMIVLALVASLMLATVPASAGSGFADCGTGGYGYTSGSGSMIRTHKFGPSTQYSNGLVSHGFYYGSQYWSVSGPPTTNGYCVT